MAYARFGWHGSNVYVFPTSYERDDHSSYNALECCACSMGDDFVATSTQAMVDHLAEHTRRGDCVPGHVVPYLWADNARWFGGEDDHAALSAPVGGTGTGTPT